MTATPTSTLAELLKRFRVAVGLTQDELAERAGIYALGAVLYELLTGHAPHEAETPYEVAAKSLMGKITLPSALVPGINQELEDVIMIALASDPAARYPDASSFAFAARRAVFPRGASLLTELPGLRRATRENAMLSRPRRLRRANESTHPLAPRAINVVWPAPSIGKGRTGRPQLTARTLFITIAATALVVMLCGAASLSLARQMKVPILGFAPTATVKPDGYALTHRNTRTDCDTHPYCDYGTQTRCAGCFCEGGYQHRWELEWGIWFTRISSCAKRGRLLQQSSGLCGRIHRRSQHLHLGGNDGGFASAAETIWRRWTK